MRTSISRRLRHSAPLVLLLLCSAGCATRSRDSLYQYSTINALLAGVYDGDLTCGELRRHGDFGLGTFDALDGEMIALDGRYYQIRSDGKVLPVRDSLRTPFAVVTFFQPTRSLTVTNAGSFHALEQWLDQMLPAKNAFYAIRIDGEFTAVKARSVPRQQKPYPPLVVASKAQAIFEFQNVTGTLVGFRTPEFMQGLNVPGYHFHFLTANRQAGGHVLDCALHTGTVVIDETGRFTMELPGRGAFGTTDLAKERKSELDAVEKAAPDR